MIHDPIPTAANSYHIIRPETGRDSLLAQGTVEAVNASIVRHGWVVLRGFAVAMPQFSDLVAQLCRHITFDPAREYSEANTQKVDAGFGPIGLHIENGNTPRCPDLVAFYARTAAFEGSQTTICDGVDVLAALPEALRERWSQKMTVSRRLPEALWKRYLVNEHPALSDPSQITQEHILQFKAATPGQDYEMHDDGAMTYHLTLDAVRPSRFSSTIGFANAVLGPSHNYEPPRYVMADGTEVTRGEIANLAAIAETCTHEVNWQDGDIAVLDNTRVMHGRRAIVDANRELFIGMGSI